MLAAVLLTGLPDDRRRLPCEDGQDERVGNPDPETRCGLRLGRRAGPIRASRDGRIVELNLHCRVDHAFGNEVLITIEANTQRQTRTRALCGMTGRRDLALWEDVTAGEHCSADGSKIGRKGSATS